MLLSPSLVLKDLWTLPYVFRPFLRSFCPLISWDPCPPTLNASASPSLQLPQATMQRHPLSLGLEAPTFIPGLSLTCPCRGSVTRVCWSPYHRKLQPSSPYLPVSPETRSSMRQGLYRSPQHRHLGVTLQVLSGWTDATTFTGIVAWCVSVCVCVVGRARRREGGRDGGRTRVLGSQQALNLSLLVNYYLNEGPQGTWHFACSLGEAASTVKYSEYTEVLSTNVCPEGEENL